MMTHLICSVKSNILLSTIMLVLALHFRMNATSVEKIFVFGRKERQGYWKVKKSVFDRKERQGYWKVKKSET